MTVSSTTSKNTYNGNGSTTVFAYAFRILAEGDILVQVEDAAGTLTTKTITTDYTVSGVGDAAGGNITFVTAPASGETVVLSRNLSITQEVDYSENDAFPAETHEEALDRLTMINQQQTEEIDRAIRLPITTTITDATAAPVTATYVLRINSAGNGLEFVSPTTAALATSVTPTDGVFLVGDGSDFVGESGATARTSLGLGTIATQAASSVSITGGSISGITDLAVADGGTGASTASAARTNLGVAIGSDVQAYDAGLTSIAGLTTAADKMVYTTGSDTYAVTPLTSFARTILDDADEATFKATVNLEIGTDVQAQNATLQTIADGGAVDLGGHTSFEVPNGTSVTTNAAGEIAMDTTGNGTTVTTGVIQGYDGTQNLYFFGATNYPSTDNDVMVYDSATNAVKWEAQSGAGSGLADVVDDTTPQLGGQLDVNGNAIGDGTLELITFTEDASAVNHINIENEATGSGPIVRSAGDDTNVDLNIDTKGTGALNFKVGGTTKADLTGSGLQLGGSGARVTTVLDEDTMSSDSATALATQQSIKAYVDSQAGGGKLLQQVTATTSSVASGTTVIPADDTVPQSSEGFQVLTATITPSSATSTLIIRMETMVARSASAAHCTMALFRDSTAGALCASATTFPGDNLTIPLSLEHSVASGSTSATTFKMRVGPNSASTLTINGTGGSTRRYGGVACTSITILEVEA